MKIHSTILLPLLFCSCYNTDRGINQLNQRVTRLEQRIDSLANTKTENSRGYINVNTNREEDRCMRMTKKGTRCKRKAKSNGYCWQHGG